MLTRDDIYAIESAITALRHYEGDFYGLASAGESGLRKILDRHKESGPQPIETAPIVVKIWLAGESRFVDVDAPEGVQIKCGNSD